MTQFTRRKFAVPAPGTAEYRDNYEKTFGKKPEPGRPATTNLNAAHLTKMEWPGALCSCCAAPRTCCDAGVSYCVEHCPNCHGHAALAAAKPHVFTLAPGQSGPACSICGYPVEHELHHQVTPEPVEATALTPQRAVEFVDNAVDIARELAMTLLRPLVTKDGLAPPEMFELEQHLNAAAVELTELWRRLQG